MQTAYVSWCEENGYKKEANPRVLWTQLTDRGFKEHRTNRTRYRTGIRLLRPGEIANNESTCNSTRGADATVTTVTDQEGVNQVAPAQQLDLVTVKSDSGTSVTVTPASRMPASDGGHGNVTVTVPVITVTDKPLNGNHLQKSDGGDSETAPPSQRFPRMSGLQVIHLAESAGVVLHLNGDGQLCWDFDHVKPGTDVDDLICLLFVHDAEVRHILRAQA